MGVILRVITRIIHYDGLRVVGLIVHTAAAVENVQYLLYE